MKNFKFKWLLLSFILSIASINQVWADSNSTWIGNSFIIVNGYYYRGSGGGTNTAFNSANLGSLTSLSLGGEIQDYGQDKAANHCPKMHYKFDDASSSYITLAYWKYSSPNNYFKTEGETVDISELSVGDHTLSVWFEQPQGNQWDSNNNNNYVANFTIDPKVTFSVSPAGAASNPTNDASINSGDGVTSGTTVIFTHADANTGYEWYRWEDGEGNELGNGSTYTASSISAHTTVVAVYREKSYSTTVAVSPAASGSISSPTPSDGKINVLHHTGTSVTASANTNYIFDRWTVSDGGLTMVSSNTTNPNTFKATSTGGTITANFADQYAIVGIAASGTTADWSYFRGLPNIGTNTFSKTYTLTKGSYSFKVVDRKNSTWYTAGSVTVNRANPSKTASTTGGEGNHMTLTVDVTGDYTFTFNTSTKALSVTYPTAYAVNYSASLLTGSGSYKTGNPSAEATGSIAVTSADLVLAGKDVTFTTPAANTGYTFHGWFSTSTPTIGSTTPLSTELSYTVENLGAAVTVYAIYTEDMHTVTVNVDNGTITTPAGGAGSTVSAGISTTASIAASAAYGYVFNGWSVVGGGSEVTFANASSTSTTINATADATIKANFFPHWTVAGGDSDKSDGDDAMGDWNLYTNGIDDFAQINSKWHGYSTISLPANSTFYFKIYDHTGSPDWYGNTGTMSYTNHENWTMTKDAGNCTFNTAGKGDYVFDWNETDKKLTVTYPTSYIVTYNVSTFYNDDASHEYDNTTGGSITYVKDNDSIAFTSGKYVVSGGTVTFKATPAAGYTFAGWYKDQACTSAYTNGSDGAAIVGSKLTLTVGGDKTVYAKFTEIMTTVAIRYTKTDDISGARTGWVKVGGVTKEPDSKIKVGVHTTVTLRAEADSSSHYYGGWSYFVHEDYEKADSVGADYHCDLTLRGKGAGDDYQSIYVSFPQLEKIYFKNWNDETKTQLWDSVYVGFNPNWNSTEGGCKTYNGADMYDKQDSAFAMQRESEDTYHYDRGEYNYYCMWWAYVPRHITRTGCSKVVFFNKAEMIKQEHFWNGKVAHRTDYNKGNDMFVPASKSSGSYNCCDYYSNGYWRNYWALEGNGQGYYLEKRTGTNTFERLGEFKETKGTTYTNEFLVHMEYTIRFDNISAVSYRVVSAGGEHYVANADITAGASETYLKSNNTSDAYFTMTPSAEGNYTFIIEQSSDTMDFSVDYPVAIGDYIIENTYDDGSSKTTRSNVIKASVADTKTRYSMFLSTEGSETLILRKCSTIVDKKPVWQNVETAATAGSKLADILTAVGSTPGVYQFDITIDKSTNKVFEVDSLRLYTGDYYLKADSTRGGWELYKENVMDKNTVNFDRTSATYDNYWCHYYYTNTANIKCVIANDYCNQLSDTMKSDGIARLSGTEPFVPVAGTSIRFSYNSATNTIGRAYLDASKKDNFLNVVANASPANSVYLEDGTTNVTTATAKQRKFEDLENWVYEINLKVIPGGKAGVTATYNDGSSDHVQTLISTDNVVLGCQEGKSCTSKYAIRVVYDFKTNYMMSAFVLDGTTITEDLSDFDMMWVRHKDESATQLTLGSGKSLKNVRVVGAIELRYDSLNTNIDYEERESGWVDLRYFNEQTRPFMKYFVSFPFDVELNSIFGLNQATYGRWGDYVIQKYDGATRAKDGLFFGDGDNYWIDLEPGDTLHANEGYCVIFDNDYLRGDYGSRMWENKKPHSSVFLYFPAMEPIASITNEDKTSTVAAHNCTINRWWSNDSKKNHINTDSHWNMIGSPLFHDSYIKDTTNKLDTFMLRSFYYLDYYDNKWYPRAAKEEPLFKAMSSKYVQWCGTITWTTTSTNIFTAPRRVTAEDMKNNFAKLEIIYNNKVSDWAYVEMREGADTAFVLREDMCKYRNTGIPNIYTFAGAYDVAYNTTSLETQTIPVGVTIRKNGTYTFSMPTNFSGTVTLIDTYTQTRTNLALDDYEVYLEKGTIDDRFELEINVNKMPTAIDGAEDGSGSLKDGKAHKFIENGVMYILENGRIYDARGNRVQ